jgi:Flp pilus assembly protein TadD
VDPLRALAFAGQGALRLMLPLGLTIEPAAPPPALALLGAVALLAGAAASVACWRRRSALLVPVVLGGGQLAIASVAAVRLDALADRYLLLPSLALGGLVAMALAPVVRVGGRPAIGAIGAIAVASLGLGGLSFAHARSFRSDTALFSRAWQRNPDSVRAALNLAAANLREGRAEEALVWLDRAEALSPGDVEIALNRAAARQRLGDPAKAQALLQAALGSAPRDPRLHTALGHLALADGRPDAARDHYLVATRVNPLRADAWSGLGIAQARLGEMREARSALEHALALDPDLEDAPALRTLLDRIPPD